MRRSDVGVVYAIEVWGPQYGEETWKETGYQDLTSREEVARVIDRSFGPEPTRVVEYTTTSRVLD